jgi:hypothetical protein
MKRQRLAVGLAMMAVLSLAGCSRGYFGAYYRPVGGAGQPTVSDIKIQDLSFMVESGFAERCANLRAQGYELLGISSFIAPLQYRRGAVRQARSIGADYVFLHNSFFDEDEGKPTAGAYPTPEEREICREAELADALSSDAETNPADTAEADGATARKRPSYSAVAPLLLNNTTLPPYTIDRYKQTAVFMRKN